VVADGDRAPVPEPEQPGRPTYSAGVMALTANGPLRPACSRTDAISIGGRGRWAGRGLTASPEQANRGPVCTGYSSVSAADSACTHTARTPRTALRRTSAAANSASHSGTMASGIIRPRAAGPHHSSTIQSLWARTQSSPSSWSAAPGRQATADLTVRQEC